MLTVGFSFVQPLSLASLDSSPSRGASGEEEKFSAMPRPPLGRGGGTASAVTERLSPAAAHGRALLRTTSQSRRKLLDSSSGRGASGEEEKFSAMPKPPLGRGGGTASAVTERLSPALSRLRRD